MMRTHNFPADIFVTGASGLVGAAVIERLLALDDTVRVHALVRRISAWPALAARLGPAAARVSPVVGDVTLEALGLDHVARARLAWAGAVIHCAADTSFSNPLDVARACNTDGTRHLLELCAAWRVERFVHLSTAYVAGMRTGAIDEVALDGSAGFVNGYEQSKLEAEQLVRASGVPHVVLRPSTIVCDDELGSVTQYNAVHRALRVLYNGLGSLIPGAEETPIDVVTLDHVVDGVTNIGFARDALGGTYHLCAGAGALPLGEMLDRLHAVWSRDPQWRRRSVARPALADLATYRLFEEAVDETGDVRLATITRSLSHFVPQLALPKRFATERADALLDRAALPVHTFWNAMVEHLAATRWGLTGRRAA